VPAAAPEHGDIPGCGFATSASVTGAPTSGLLLPLLDRLRIAAQTAAASSFALVWLSPFALFLDEAAFGALRGGCVMSLPNGLGLGTQPVISTQLLAVPPSRVPCFAMTCGLAMQIVAQNSAERLQTVDGAASVALTQAAARVGMAVHPLSSQRLFPTCPRDRLPNPMPPGPLIVFATE
jgi:hypothetical protein